MGVLAIIITIRNGGFKYKERNFYIKHVLFGLIFLTLGWVFFFIGLDDEKDYLRHNHSIWHFFGGWGGFLFMYAKRDVGWNI